MLHYWLSVFLKAFWDSLAFTDRSRQGLAFWLLVIAITAFFLWKKHGWKNAMKHFWRTSGEGVLIAGVSYLLVFICHFIFEPYHLQDDERSRKIVAVSERDFSRAEKISCDGDVQVAKSQVELLRSQVFSQQGVINGQMETGSKQQSTFNLCVATLAKTNAPIPQKLTMVAMGDDAENPPESKHTMLIVFLTNKEVTPVKLAMWCDHEVKKMTFQPAGVGAFNGGMQPMPDGKTWILAMGFPVWAPEVPLTVRVHYDEENLGECYSRKL